VIGEEELDFQFAIFVAIDIETFAEGRLKQRYT
jgi:hypothetical protein